MTKTGLEEIVSMDPDSKWQVRIAILAIAVFALVELLVGILSVVILTKTDSIYSDLIDTQTPLLNQLRMVTQESANVHRFCLNLMLAENATEIQRVLERIKAARAKHDVSWEKIDQFHENARIEPFLSKLRKDRTAYFEARDLFLALKPEEARTFRVNVLRPAFDSYQASQEHLSEELEADIIKESDAATARTKGMIRILTGLASAPFVAVLGLLLTSGLLFVSVLWLHKARRSVA